MALAFDNTLVREPGLLVPGRKPVGTVIINRTALARGLRLALIPSIGAQNLCAEWDVSSYGATRTVTEHGVGDDVTGSSATALDCGYGLSAGGSGDRVVSGSFTFLFDVFTTGVYDSDGRSTFFDSRYLSDSGYALYHNDGGTSLSFLVDKGSIADVITVPNALTTFGRQRVAVSRCLSTGMVIMAVDGDVVYEAAASAGNYQPALSVVAILRRQYFSDSSTSLDNYKGICYSVLGWDRALSKEECRCITHDPYQFLIPAG